MGYLILCVDDDIDDCELLTLALKETIPDTKLIFVSTGSKAVEKLEELSKDNVTPSMIILDINLPGLDGKATFQKIHAKFGLLDVPKLVLSTTPRDEDVDFFLEFGVPVMAKPVSLKGYDEIVEVIKKTIVPDSQTTKKPTA